MPAPVSQQRTRSSPPGHVRGRNPPRQSGTKVSRGACRCQGRSRPPVWWRVVPATRCPSWCAPGFGTTPQRAGTLRPWHPWAPRRGSHRASAHDPGEPSQGARRPGRCGPEQEVVAIVVTPVGCCTSSEDHTVANAAGAPPRGPGRLGSRRRCCVPTWWREGRVLPRGCVNAGAGKVWGRHVRRCVSCQSVWSGQPRRVRGALA